MNKKASNHDVDEMKILRPEKKLIYDAGAFEDMIPEEEIFEEFEGSVPRDSIPKPTLNLKLDKNSSLTSKLLPTKVENRSRCENRQELREPELSQGRNSQRAH
jgi:hypothetical protein